MPLNHENAEVCLDAVAHRLSDQNVNSIDVGYKNVAGKATGELAIVFYVTQKKHAHLLGPADNAIPGMMEVTIPATDGTTSREMVVTDVVQRPPLQQAVLDQRIRPTEGGYQVMVVADWFGDQRFGGTLGVNIDWGGRLRLLSNNHVLSNNGNQYSNLYQPGYVLGSRNEVAKVTNYIPVRTYANPRHVNPTLNKYDFAWADIDANLASTAIKDIGVPTGIRAPVVNEAVSWIGKTTGVVQHATIQSITMQTSFIFSQARYAFWKNLITLNGGQVRQGDSGSAIVADNDMMLVGLVMVNNANLDGFGCRIPPH